VSKNWKKIEQKVILYFWPDHPRDEMGSVRDHASLHDGSGPSSSGGTVWVEIKSEKIKRTTAGIWRVMYGALDQLEVAIKKKGIQLKPEDVLVSVWCPSGIKNLDNMLCAVQIVMKKYTTRVVMKAIDFKRVFCGRYDNDKV